MQQIPKPLAVIDGETLMDKRLPKRSFCIETLLPEGISMLGGAPKIGKSWMVLDIGVRVAKGESIWSLPTKRGTVLYLALEDSLARIQERLCKLTDDVSGNLFFAIAAGTLADDLCFQIEQFISEHRDTVLVIIDTFQIVRVGGIDTSYANDYDEVRKLKALADKMRISLLLVHHLRKQGDSDPLNKLSGTTGISGAMDAVFILDVSKRHAHGATLFCTGRDTLSERRMFSPKWKRVNERSGKKSPSVFSTPKRQITLAEPSRLTRTVGVILMIQTISYEVRSEQGSKRCSKIFFLPYPTHLLWTRSPS